MKKAMKAFLLLGCMSLPVSLQALDFGDVLVAWIIAGAAERIFAPKPCCCESCCACSKRASVSKLNWIRKSRKKKIDAKKGLSDRSSEKQFLLIIDDGSERDKGSDQPVLSEKN